MVHALIGFLLMLWEKIISKSVFVYAITVGQYFDTICERGDEKSLLPKNRRLLLWGQGTDFGCNQPRNLSQKTKGHLRMALFICLLPENLSHLRINLTSLHTLSNILPSHDIEVSGIFHILAKRIFLDLEVEVDIFISLVGYSAYPDISEIGSCFYHITDYESGRHFRKVGIKRDISIHGLEPNLFSSKYIEVLESIIPSDASFS